MAPDIWRAISPVGGVVTVNTTGEAWLLLVQGPGMSPLVCSLKHARAGNINSMWSMQRTQDHKCVWPQPTPIIS